MNSNAFIKKYSDAAKRIADEMTMHSVNGKAGCWASFRLSDGTSDHTPYERRTDAVKANKWYADDYMYLEVYPDGLLPEVAEVNLQFARMLHDAGWSIPDPEFNYDPTMPFLQSDRNKTIAHLASGGRKI